MLFEGQLAAIVLGEGLLLKSHRNTIEVSADTKSEQRALIPFAND